MTIEEAKIYLPYTEEDEIVDLYQDKLFEFKQFFLIQSPIAKVFLAKLAKLEKIDLAYETLTKKALPISDKEHNEFTFSDEVLVAFNLFETQKSKLRIAISNSENGNELKQFIEQLLDLAKSYRQKWAIGAELEVEIEVLSKEPDSMDIHKAINEFMEHGGVFFNDIIEQKTNPILMKEMKRVSLLLEKY